MPEPVCVPRATRRRVMTTNERGEGAHAFFVCSLLFAEIYGGRRCRRDRENSGSGVFRLPSCRYANGSQNSRLPQDSLNYFLLIRSNNSMMLVELANVLILHKGW